MAYCKLSWKEITKYETQGIKPDCKHHHHCSRTQAFIHIENEEAIKIPGRSAIVMCDWYDKNYQWVTIQPGLKKGGKVGCLGPVGLVAKQFIPVGKR
jgi:hypothetical protein